MRRWIAVVALAAAVAASGCEGFLGRVCERIGERMGEPAQD